MEAINTYTADSLLTKRTLGWTDLSDLPCVHCTICAHNHHFDFVDGLRKKKFTFNQIGFPFIGNLLKGMLW